MIFIRKCSSSFSCWRMPFVEEANFKTIHDILSIACKSIYVVSCRLKLGVFANPSFDYSVYLYDWISASANEIRSVFALTVGGWLLFTVFCNCTVAKYGFRTLERFTISEMSTSIVGSVVATTIATLFQAWIIFVSITFLVLCNSPQTMQTGPTYCKMLYNHILDSFGIVLAPIVCGVCLLLPSCAINILDYYLNELNFS